MVGKKRQNFLPTKFYPNFFSSNKVCKTKTMQLFKKSMNEIRLYIIHLNIFRHNQTPFIKKSISKAITIWISPPSRFR